MGIKDLFRGVKKPEKPAAARLLVPQDKAERMNYLFKIGCSIRKGTFRAAGPFLAARHGYNTHISAWALYFNADQVFQDARQLAKEIGDKKKEAEILYNWALLQWHPPEKGISFMSGSASEKLEKMMDLARSGENKPAGDNEPIEDKPYVSSPDLALQFFLEALALAEQSGHDLVAAACLLYSAQIYKARGDAAKYFAQMEKLREKAMRFSEAQTQLPLWLLNEIKAEVES